MRLFKSQHADVDGGPSVSGNSNSSQTLEPDEPPPNPIPRQPVDEAPEEKVQDVKLGQKVEKKKLSESRDKSEVPVISAFNEKQKLAPRFTHIRSFYPMKIQRSLDHIESLISNSKWWKSILIRCYVWG